MRTLLGLALIMTATVASPPSGASERIELKFSAQDMGCLTGALTRLNTDDSVLFRPYPDAPDGRGVILSVSPSSFRTLVTDLTTLSAACLQRASGLSAQAWQAQTGSGRLP